MASDLLRPGLELLFCGYNPSLRSGLSGHHYAHPGNRFWRVLYAAGVTDRMYLPEDDVRLLDLGIGFTNLASRPARLRFSRSSNATSPGPSPTPASASTAGSARRRR